MRIGRMVWPRLSAAVAVLMGVPLLTLGLAVGTATSHTSFTAT
jgi:hypothetical protein